MAPRGFEDEELTMSLSSSHVRRQNHDHHERQQQQQKQKQQQQHAAGNDPVASSARTNTAPATAMNSTPQRKEKVKTEQRIGAYKVVRTLGEGSFGKVKLAIHNGTGQQVALKIIARKKLISRDMAGRVEREIEYLQLLRHPHIIKLYVIPPIPHGERNIRY
jgi:carbon catabolite-derepressing protein kinase